MERGLISPGRHPLLTTLSVLQMALGYPVLLAMGTLASQAHARRHAASGIDDDAQLLTLRLGGRVSAAQAEREAAALDAIPGVLRVAAINRLPFVAEHWRTLIGPRGADPLAAARRAPAAVQPPRRPRRARRRACCTGCCRRPLAHTTSRAGTAMMPPRPAFARSAPAIRQGFRCPAS
ncbi:hypothetical protein [Xanthomonas translucens]|uniref:hypothetical protein n=1 Tax=Xanthomonas campestris pv. translucens TaxID=343 RepID=UPI001E34F648|nr:hypothetical protein [Xanthomonas translucens]MCS3358711.1 hypothetical protein [Xanthomonas translucens pv. translucens]MCS3372880.1 hypothetical protein [Xanthomonas translucens pv. translucens]MCT8273583.1 hypothetical protein [Xanthomonas translucens pv. translucens]MCT8277251.1 hypothetical protein [Xanthomonas translucens pv. translucens]MCT8288084.1 hypothetical protein [Xanthomonas translucens pv. translucens]